MRPEQRLAIEYVDSASLYQVDEVLDVGSPDRCSAWGLLVANDVTMLGILGRPLRLAPGLPDLRQPAGHYGHLLRELERHGLLSTVPLRASDGSQAVESIRRCLAHHTAVTAVQAELSALKQDANFASWFGWIKGRAWPLIAWCKDGLIMREFSVEIASILGVSTNEIRQVVAQSAHPTRLSAAMRGSGAAELTLLEDAYLVSLLLRGQLYELTVGDSAKLLRHPLRRLATVDTLRAFREERTQFYFSCAILHEAMQQRRTEERIASWTRLVLQARRVAWEAPPLTVDEVLLPSGERLTDDQALDIAAREAAKLRLGSSTRRIVDGIECMVALILAAASSALSGWTSLELSLPATLAQIVMEHADVPSRVHHRRVRRMAAVAGDVMDPYADGEMVC